MILTCRFCGKEFAPKRVVQKGDKTRSVILDHADHELKCPDKPDRQTFKDTTAWNPVPWGHDLTGRVTPNAERITYVGGPLHGQFINWEAFLVDGTRIVLEPPLQMAGPTVRDSRQRVCAKYMGHYELRVQVIEGIHCPVYIWVPTITPKKRLAPPTAFAEAWPDLAVKVPIHAAVSTRREDESEQPEQENEDDEQPDGAPVT